MDTIPQKQCTVCNGFFPATSEYFHRCKTQKDGLMYRCKACVKAYQTRPDVRERMLARDKEYRQLPEIIERERARARERNQRPEVIEHNRARDMKRHRSAKRQAWLQDYNNRPEVIERKRAYMEVYHKEYYSQSENYESKRFQDKQYYEGHKEQHKQQSRQYYETHRERHRELGRVNSSKRRSQKREVPGTYTHEQIQDLLKRQKHKCYYCSTKFEKKQGKYVYHIEHTFPLNRVAGTDIPANDISYLVLSCPFCNHSKHDKFPWEWHEGGRLL